MERIPISPLAAILFLLGLSSSVSGQYCSYRGCCPGRDDNCHIDYHDTLCYCDEFCHRTNSDCCPDYYGSLCHFTPSPPSQSTPTSSGDTCFFDERAYGPGETIQNNCNTCTCQVNELFGGLEFQCGVEKCAIELPEVHEINKGWSAKNYSKFWGKTQKEARLYYTGTLEAPAGVADQYEVDIMKAKELPESFDARVEWPGWIGGIQDQGKCGSSWAASTIAVVSDILAIHSKGTDVKRLSLQHLLSCNTRGQLGCDGGYTDRAYQFLRKRGVVTEECYPLESGQSEATEMDKLPCRLGYLQSYPCPNRGVTSDLQTSTPAYRIGMNQEEMMYQIHRNGPVQATFKVKEDFFSYESGVYRHLGDGEPSEHEGFHSVRILGWGVDPDSGLPYWLCANSWGTEWGEDGYFRILRGSNECEIESFVVGVWGQVEANMGHA